MKQLAKRGRIPKGPLLFRCESDAGLQLIGCVTIHDADPGLGKTGLVHIFKPRRDQRVQERYRREDLLLPACMVSDRVFTLGHFVPVKPSCEVIVEYPREYRLLNKSFHPPRFANERAVYFETGFASADGRYCVYFADGMLADVERQLGPKPIWPCERNAVDAQLPFIEWRTEWPAPLELVFRPDGTVERRDPSLYSGGSRASSSLGQP